MPGMLQGAIARGSEEASFKMTGRQGSAALLYYTLNDFVAGRLRRQAGRAHSQYPTSGRRMHRTRASRGWLRIAPMDMLTVKVFKMPDLSGEYEVDLAGHISMPLIGEISAYDLTTAQLDEALTRKLGEYLGGRQRRDQGIDPAKCHGRRGRHRSGSFPVHGPMTLMQAVAAAGGAREDANVRRVAIFRTIGGV